MKPSVILPIVTALAGFGVGWLVKPAPQTSGPPAVKIPVREASRSAPSAMVENRGPTGQPARPEKILPPVAPDQATPAAGPQDDAKLARLIEALSLNEDQKAEVLKAIAAAQATLSPEGGMDPAKLMDLAQKAGVNLEKAILSSLTPEQVTAFAALRKRSQDNNVETNSQSRVSKVSSFIDLSPEQRGILLDRVRAEIRNDYDQRPQGLDLVLDTSPLPTGSVFLTDSSIAAMPYLSGGPDANEKMAALREQQRKNLDSQIEKYRDILTPAQLSRLQADIDEKKRILDVIEERTRD